MLSNLCSDLHNVFLMMVLKRQLCSENFVKLVQYIHGRVVAVFRVVTFLNEMLQKYNYLGI